MLPGFQWGGVRFEFEPANVMENGGDWRFPQETPTVALPGWRPGEGSTTSAIGEDASTSAGCPAIVTSLASASPQKTFCKELEAVTKRIAARMKLRSKWMPPRRVRKWRWRLAPRVPQSNHNHAGIQRRHEKGPARRIGREPVPVRKIHRNSRSQPPVHVQHRERGALARNDSPRQQKYSRSGSRWR